MHAASVSFLLFVCLFVFNFFVCVLPKKGVIVPGRAFHKLLGNFLATSGIWSNFFRFQQLFCFLSNFSPVFSTSEISEQPLELKLAFLKKEPDPPPWGWSWAKDACSRAARSAVFKRKLNMADEACLRWRRSFNNFIGSYYNFYKINFDIDRSSWLWGHGLLILMHSLYS